MMASGRTWIVVLDDSRARFFKREISGSLTESASEVNVGGSEGRAPATASRRAERDRLLHEALGTVEKACARNECERIVVIAPERMLSAFRKQASDNVRVRLWRERADEMTRLSAEDIGQSVDVYFRTP
jgi:protein required for attachment to host cells